MTDHEHDCCAHEPDPEGTDFDFIRLGVETRQWAWGEVNEFDGTFEDKLLAARRLAAWALTGGDLVLEDEDEIPGEDKPEPLKPGEPGDWH